MIYSRKYATLEELKRMKHGRGKVRHAELVEALRTSFLDRGCVPVDMRMALARHGHEMVTAFTFNNIDGKIRNGRLCHSVAFVACDDLTFRPHAYYGFYDREICVGYPTHLVMCRRWRYARHVTMLKYLTEVVDGTICAATFEDIVDGPGGLLQARVSEVDYACALVNAGRKKLSTWTRIGVMDRIVAARYENPRSWDIMTAFGLANRKAPVPKQVRSAHRLCEMLPCPTRDELRQVGLFGLIHRL